ncbi:RNA polymerase subunit sigma-70 [Streptomyces sp. PLAI1-29]|uniref:RNA polymerase subunit sigma-70 n=1 Tax=Streptomyces zingiberis TaxID=2053010 RepID=A0ABX1BS73_9ACTN|nr:RNA polymerase subunit sigma-70 [Streptomyces zingiberis]
MRKRRAERDRRRSQEFDAFVAGAAGRLLHTATLLTADLHAAERLLTAALARTYARWDRLRGEDPYDVARQELATRFARAAWRRRHPHGGVLDGLTPRERLVVVLRLYEGVAEEQTAAQLGLDEDRVRAICHRSVALLRSTPRPALGASVPAAARAAPGSAPWRTESPAALSPSPPPAPRLATDPPPARPGGLPAGPARAGAGNAGGGGDHGAGPGSRSAYGRPPAPGGPPP